MSVLGCRLLGLGPENTKFRIEATPFKKRRSFGNPNPEIRTLVPQFQQTCGGEAS